MLLGSKAVRGGGAEFFATNPATVGRLEPGFAGPAAAADGLEEVNAACLLAEAALDPYRETSLEARAGFLETIADELLALGDALIERAMAETALPRPRLEGERARTAGQLRLYAQVVREGGWLDATLDPPLPDRKPLPRADLRRRNIALGPVAVFGASNFPLAYSVAGGDTASALAAGCPVIAKSHPSHLGTSELAGRAIQAAVAKCGMPAGVFSLVLGEGNAVGEALVKHPAIQAVGFTGSRRGGLALARLCAARPQPIPIYAEMSSVNPIFLLPAALEVRAEALGAGFIDSLTLGVGQFCTNPGLVFAIAGPNLDRFTTAAAAAIATRPSGIMLNRGIAEAFATGRNGLLHSAGVELLAEGAGTGAGAEQGAGMARPALFRTSGATFLANPALAEEHFGPASLVVACSDFDQMLAVARALEGQLTSTLHLEASDYGHARALLPILERKAGRLVINGFPTGVEVGHAIVHGGPYPATTDSRTTSVGAKAIERFLRPVCYQDFPEALLPAALQQANPDAISRRVAGIVVNIAPVTATTLLKNA
jgi:NADP-dependent aldehyde dehydrogenase